MDDFRESLAAEIAKVGATLPKDDLAILCNALDTLTPSQSITSASASICQPEAKDLCVGLLGLWATLSPPLPPSSLSLALRTAWLVDDSRRRSESIELVWTGPSPTGSALRRTDQVLLEMIEHAKKTLTIVTFAHYKVPKVHEALLQANKRGVRVRLVCETKESSDGKYDLDLAAMMAPDLAQVAEVYVWPAEKRPKSADGKTGLLHAKCAIRDKEVLIVSSANLTGKAMYSNMEMGIVLRNARLAASVETHFEQLIGAGILAKAGN